VCAKIFAHVATPTVEAAIIIVYMYKHRAQEPVDGRTLVQINAIVTVTATFVIYIYIYIYIYIAFDKPERS
jgi:hypothetical protein